VDCVLKSANTQILSRLKAFTDCFRHQRTVTALPATISRLGVMNPLGQTGASKTENCQHHAPYLQEEHAINVCGSNVERHLVQNQDAPISVEFNERSAPRMLGHQRQPDLSTLTQAQVEQNGYGWPLEGPGTFFGNHFLGTNSSSGPGQGRFNAGHDLQYQFTTPQIPSQFTGQQQLFRPLPVWQPTETVDFHGESSKTGVPEASEAGYNANPLGLLTPVPTNAQNSPPDERAPGTAYGLESQSQQIWGHNYDAALNVERSPDASAEDIFCNEFAAPSMSAEYLWRDFDFDSLNGLFSVGDTTTLGPSGVASNAVALRQDMQPQFHHGGHAPDYFPNRSFDPFLTSMNYPDPDYLEMCSESATAPQASRPPFTGQADAYSIAPSLPALVDAFNAPSPAESLPRTPSKSSQSKDAKDALLIEWKEQGMSYKDIKAQGGFEEAESTLRGRYRTLTKPKQERVRRPEWGERDVSSLYHNWQQRRHSRSKRWLCFSQLWSILRSLVARLSSDGQVEELPNAAERNRRFLGSRSPSIWRTVVRTNMDIRLCGGSTTKSTGLRGMHKREAERANNRAEGGTGTSTAFPTCMMPQVAPWLEL